MGFLPEGEIHSRSKGSSPYEVGHSLDRYPMERVLRQAEIASSLDPQEAASLVAGLKDSDSAVRYWSALGFVMRGKAAVDPHRAALREAFEDESPYVRIAAAEALGTVGYARRTVLPAGDGRPHAGVQRSSQYPNCSFSTTGRGSTTISRGT